MSRRPWTPRRFGRLGVTVLQGLCAIHAFNRHVAEIRPCSGASMYPTLSLRGAYILHCPLLLQFSPVKRGELVTAVSPLDPSHHVLKRVIALEGDTVLIDPTGDKGIGTDSMVTVPKGSIWLAGDNLSNSTDSRDYGAVPLALVKGKVVARVWPEPAWLNSTMRRVDHL
ncbi:hypothetical protein OIO90_006097 [Microbotryomycetes sp. JL221]|nr:hypothetical protein OIO90_006097 [Microbotryomycetes sp. JL221]